MKPVFSKRTRPLTILCASLIAALFSFTSTPLTRAADAVPLGSVKNFSVLAGGGIFAFGAPAATIDARLNYGTFPSPTINNSQAFLPQIGLSRVPHAADSVAQTAQVDLANAYSNLASQPVTGTIPLQLDGITITTGVYKASNPSPFYTLSGTITLDAQNDATAVFIIKGTRLTTSANTAVISLINGARACNVYWFMETVAVNSLVSLGENTYFFGNVVTDRDIFLAKNVKGNMRLLTKQGEVHLKEGDLIDPLPDVECPQHFPSPTPTPTSTISSSTTPTATTSATPTTTATTSTCGAGTCPTPTPTTTATTSSCGAGTCLTPTQSASPSVSPSPSASSSPTPTSPSPTQTASPSVSSSPTSSSSSTPTSNTTPKPSPSPTEKPTPTFSPSPTTSPTTAVLTSPTPTPTETQQVPIKPIGFVATDTNYKMLANLKSPNENYYQNFTTLNKSAPVTISIPAIKVNSKIIGLGFDAEGGMEVPNSGKIAGYFTGAPTPGELGPAIIVGHVDWQGKIGIFYNLKKLKSGDKVIIKRQDGKIVNFKVTKVMTVPKLKFPTDLVYGNLNYPGLRLITCGGKFDAKLKRHVDNIIVFAQAA